MRAAPLPATADRDRRNAKTDRDIGIGAARAEFRLAVGTYPLAFRIGATLAMPLMSLVLLAAVFPLQLALLNLSTRD